MQSQTFKLKSQVVHAGAGTGKTTALISEIFKIYKDFKKANNKDPNLMVCTFTIKATQELRERLYQKAIEEKHWEFLEYIQSSSLHISTIDGILNLFLRTYSYRYEINSDFKIDNSGKEQGKLNQLFEEYFFEKHPDLLDDLQFPYLQNIFNFYVKQKLSYGEISFFDEKDFEEFKKEKEDLSKSSDREDKKLAKEEEIFKSSNFTPIFKKIKPIVEEFFKDYLEFKRKESVLTIEDMMLFSLDLLRTDQKLAKEFSKEWDYWFIDEYQDTSWIQEQIFKYITSFKNVFCVGDPKQSIYLFRGADPEVFMRRIQNEKEIKKLSTNYRSHPSLIHFFNDFFKDTKDFTNFDIPNDKTNDKKDRIFFYNCEKDDWFNFIYQRIQEIVSSGDSLNDIAILSRKNKDLKKIDSFLKKESINSFLYGSDKFSGNRLILDSLFLLKFLINPYDNLNLISLFRTPYFYLDDQKITQICYDYEQIKEDKPSLWSFVKENHNNKNIKKLEEYLNLKYQNSVLKTFEQALLERAFIDLAHYQDSSGSSESNLWKLIGMLKNSSFSLDVFYSLMEGEKESSEEPKSFFSSEAVQLMTIHKSKGLEFKHVIICDLSVIKSDRLQSETDRNPVFDPKLQKMAFAVPIGGRNKKTVKSYGQKRINQDNKDCVLGERDRLFYVAFTRAQESLTILLPSEKIGSTSWITKQTFFNKFQEDSKNFILKEGKHEQGQYSVTISKSCKKTSGNTIKEEKIKILKPYQADTESKKTFIKSSQDFEKETEILEDQKESKGIKIIYPQLKNTILKVGLGNKLHHYLYLLSYHSLENILKQIEQSYFFEEDKLKLKQALHYVSNIKDPDLNDCIKNGHPEWSFKFKKENVVLQGQIDLWVKKNKEIFVFDYKSSLSQKADKQLIFYSWILENIYQPDSIKMFTVYPFDNKIDVKKYEKSQKKQVDTWLQAFS